MSESLEFCFKGDRNYIHGTDIVASLFKKLAGNDLTEIDIRFNGIVKTGADLVEGNTNGAAQVNIQLNKNSEPKTYQLIENGHSIDCRYDYDESQIIKKTRVNIDKQSISLLSNSGYSFCENFVALNKHLLQSLYPEEKGKWYFTRLELSKTFPNDLLITVRLNKNFNFRLTKSDILIGDEVIGSVYFTMVRG